MQQAIFFDIALIFPGLIGTIGTAVAKQGEFELPKIIGDTGSTATFLVISAGIIYSMISSLLGVVPDKVPFISQRAKLRVPTAEDILKSLEAQENDWSPNPPGGAEVPRNRPDKMQEVEQIKDDDEDNDLK